MCPNAVPDTPEQLRRSRRLQVVRGSTIATLLAALLLSGTCAWLFENNRFEHHRQSVTELASQISLEIQQQLNRSLSATYALSAVIRHSNGDTSDFQKLAPELLRVYPGVSSLQIAPGGVVSQAVPLGGNEKAIGHNLLEDTARNKEALLALKTRSLTLAGPFRLIQGGEAVVGRLPVFLDHPQGQRFWGFSIAVIRIPLFLRDVGVRRIASRSYHLELSRIHPDTWKKTIFYATNGEMLRQPVVQKIQVPNGEWTLALEPVDGWYRTDVIVLEVLCVLLFSVGLALGVRWLVRQPLVLQEMVDERTRELFETNLTLQAEIRERRQAQEALSASEQKLRSICNSLTDLIFILDRDGRYLEIATTNSDALYRPAEDLVGRRLTEIFPDQTAAFFLATIRQTLSAGATITVDYPLSIAGEQQCFAGSVSPLSDNTVVWSARNITRRRRAEAEQRRLELQLLHAQKLESLGVLAGGIAHDFNNILMAIIGNADLALVQVPQESPAAHNLRQIQQAAARAADLTRQMLAYSGRGNFVVETLDLNRLLKEMQNLLELSISKMARLRFELAPELPCVEVDASQMHQIIMNLVINASEAIGDQSGTITIRTGRRECDSEYLRETWLDQNLRTGSYVFLEVTDTGCGMDAGTMAKIFEPFFTTKFTGRGLGMAAVIGIVRGHAGAIKVESEPGRGSCFRVLLPVSVKSAPKACSTAGQEGWQGQGTVLLVDDEEAVRMVAREMLGQLGFATLTATDGREALEVFRSVPGIDFVILDLSMPQMNGEQCLSELQQLQPGVKVIMSSGYAEQELTTKFAGKGIAGFIQKPYTLAQLRQALIQGTGIGGGGGSPGGAGGVHQ